MSNLKLYTNRFRQLHSCDHISCLFYYNTEFNIIIKKKTKFSKLLELNYVFKLD